MPRTRPLWKTAAILALPLAAWASPLSGKMTSPLVSAAPGTTFSFVVSGELPTLGDPVGYALSLRYDPAAFSVGSAVDARGNPATVDPVNGAVQVPYTLFGSYPGRDVSRLLTVTGTLSGSLVPGASVPLVLGSHGAVANAFTVTVLDEGETTVSPTLVAGAIAVEAPAAGLSVPDLSVPVDGLYPKDVVVSVSGNCPVRSAGFRLRYDPAVITLMDPRLSGTEAVGGTLALDAATPGVLKVTVTPPAALSYGAGHPVFRVTAVGASGPLGATSPLDLDQGFAVLDGALGGGGDVTVAPVLADGVATLADPASPLQGGLSLGPAAITAYPGSKGVKVSLLGTWTSNLSGMVAPLFFDEAVFRFPPEIPPDYLPYGWNTDGMVPAAVYQGLLDGLGNNATLYAYALPPGDGRLAYGFVNIGGRFLPPNPASPSPLGRFWFDVSPTAIPGDYPLHFGTTDVQSPVWVDPAAGGHAPAVSHAVLRVLPRPRWGLRGDANGDGKYTLGDVISLVNHIFNKPGAPPGGWLEGDSPEEKLYHGDVNSNGSVTLSDTIHLVNYIFNKPGGPWLPVSDFP